MTSPIPQKTDFSLDILGRYSCNGFDEAMLSTQRTNRPDGIDRPDARPFDVIIVYSPSRLFRDILELETFRARLEREHVKLICVSRPMGWLRQYGRVFRALSVALPESQSRR